MKREIERGEDSPCQKYPIFIRQQYWGQQSTLSVTTLELIQEQEEKKENEMQEEEEEEGYQVYCLL